MSNVPGNNNRQPSLVKKILVSILLALQIISLIFSISQTLANELDLPYKKAIFYFVIIILSGVVIYFLVSYKKWKMLTAYLLVMLVLIIATEVIKKTIEKNRITANEKNRQEEIEDFEHQFEKVDQVIGVIISAFKSPTPGDGAAFAGSLFTQLNNTIISPLQIALADTSLSLEIKVQQMNAVLDATEMKKRGKRRNADLGVIGNYRCYIEQGKHKEEITDFKVVILDTLIATVFKEKQPFDSLYDFIVPIENISVTRGDSIPAKELASSAVKYITEMAGNAKLLQTATQVRGWDRDQALSELHKRLTNLGNLINNKSLSRFHWGNSLVRSAMNPQLTLADQRQLYRGAINAYWTAIRSFAKSDSSQIKLEHPERIYFNLAWSYVQLGLLCDNSAYKDSAEAVFDAAIAQYPNRETLEEQFVFLSERCEEEFVLQKNPSRLVRAEQLFKKYQVCTDALEKVILLESRTLSEENQIALDNFAANRKLFEAHLNALRQSQQH